MSRATLAAPSSPWPGITAFVVATCVLTWGSAIVADQVWDAVRETFPTRLLSTSFYYFLTMAWPPVLAVVLVRRWIEPPGHLDLGLRSTGREALFLGGLAAAAVAAAAMLIAWLAQRLDVVSARAVPSPEPNLPYPLSLHTLLVLGVAFLGTTLLVSTQAFAEELAWRGYFLPRMMEGLGPWPGLLVHGFLWGVWYAPVVALPAQESSVASARALSFIVTCTLLGTLLGCLRLRARSLSAAVLTNAILTVVAGLPFILRGVELGPRAAAYRPAGWIPLLLAAGILAAGRARRATAPRRPDPPSADRARPSRLITRNGSH
jgi:membrane protease YdiL (CAAX protease family)